MEACVKGRKCGGSSGVLHGPYGAVMLRVSIGHAGDGRVHMPERTPAACKVRTSLRPDRITGYVSCRTRPSGSGCSTLQELYLQPITCCFRSGPRAWVSQASSCTSRCASCHACCQALNMHGGCIACNHRPQLTLCRRTLGVIGRDCLTSSSCALGMHSVCATSACQTPGIR